MRTQLAVLAALGVMSLGLVTPGVSQAARSTPDGQALVRIDGGTAYAKKKSKSEYRIVMPQGASITWMGEVKGRTTTGKFTGKALVAGWKKMGHSNGTKASTTLTWMAPGVDQLSSALVKVGKPKINSDGLVTFLAITRDTPLPRAMENFSLNVYWAKPSPVSTRGSYPVNFTTFNIDSPTNPTATVQAQLQNQGSASVTFTGINTSPAATCWGRSINLNSVVPINLPATACGSGTINSSYLPPPPNKAIPSVITYAPAVSAKNLGSITANFGYTPQGGSAVFWSYIIAKWDTSGNNKLT